MAADSVTSAAILGPLSLVPAVVVHPPRIASKAAVEVGREGAKLRMEFKKVMGRQWDVVDLAMVA